MAEETKPTEEKAEEPKKKSSKKPKVESAPLDPERFTK